MNLELILIIGSTISLVILFSFAIKFVSLEDKIDKLKSELYELEKKIKEEEK